MSGTDLVDVIDESGAITGQATRQQAHQDGLLHRVIDIWFVTPQGQVIFQRRHPQKDLSPNMLDATVGGHVDAGDTVIGAAIKETAEETGHTIDESQLIELTQYRVNITVPQTGQRTSELHYVYLYRYLGELGDLVPEAGKVVGFEAWDAAQLATLNSDERRQFVWALSDGPYPGIFDQMGEYDSPSEKVTLT